MFPAIFAGGVGKRPVLLVLTFVLSASSADAQPFAVGAEFQVNSENYLTQQDPDIARQAGAGFVIAWESQYSGGDDNSGFSAQIARFDATGSSLLSDLQVNTYTTGNQADVRLDSDAAGNFVVVWQSAGSSGSDSDGYSIQGQRFASDGTTIGGEFEVNSFTTGNQIQPDVAVADDGRFVVAWSDGTLAIAAQRFDAAGNPSGAELVIDTFGGGNDANSPAVDMAADGRFVVAWSGTPVFTVPRRDDIWARRYDSAGSALGADFIVNAYTSHDQTFPTVAMDSSGGFAVAWASVALPPGDTNGSIDLQRFDSSGTPVGAELLVNTYTTDSQVSPSVAITDGGDVIVAWHSLGSGGDDNDGTSIQTQAFDSSGSPRGGEFQVNTATVDFQVRPAVAATGTASAVLAWSSDPQPGAALFGIQLKARRIALTTTTTTTTTTLPGPVSCPSSPAEDCKVAGFGKAILTIKSPADTTKRNFRWKWNKGVQTDLAEFGDPPNGVGSFAVCVYDASARPQPLVEMSIPTGGTCGAKPCWKAAGPGFLYKDRAGSADGIGKIKLRSGSFGKAAVQVAGKGAGLPDPMLPLVDSDTVPILVQLIGDSACWDARYFSPTKNTATLFKGKGS